MINISVIMIVTMSYGNDNLREGHIKIASCMLTAIMIFFFVISTAMKEYIATSGAANKISCVGEE